ncbi:MAG: hypothetical protein HY709_10920, partial [Candidatus Latescibacteria bacterium]|nr:hypothetical protein [Candidatus Latescibacterota bacterium]
QRRQVVQQVNTYITALDRAITIVLSPTVGRSGDSYIVADDVIPLYGMGTTPVEAMEDYRSVMVEYYEDLEADATELAEPLKNQLEILRRIFRMLEQEQ